MNKIVKARLIGYDNKAGEFARKGGVIQFVSDGEKTHIDCITMPQGYKIGTTLDVFMKNKEIVRVNIAMNQEIDRTQEGLL
jgi:hypothetical protein